jgi:pimeloyl-ACP methyl ester carboxylesterase
MPKLWSTTYGNPDLEALLLIHGMGSASTAWSLITPELAKSFRVIHIDLPGHGLSQLEAGTEMDPHSLAEYILQELDNLHIKKFHAVGNSLGGWIALDLAAEHPDRVLSVVGIAPAGLWLSPVNRRLPMGAYARSLARVVHPIAPYFMPYDWAKKFGFAAVSPLWKELPQQVVIDAVQAMGSSSGYFPAWDALLSLRFDKKISPHVPVTIIFGDTDNTLPEKTSQEKSLAPLHAKWVRIAQSGHAPMWDHPQDVIREIRLTTSVASS